MKRITPTLQVTLKAELDQVKSVHVLHKFFNLGVGGCSGRSRPCVEATLHRKQDTQGTLDSRDCLYPLQLAENSDSRHWEKKITH